MGRFKLGATLIRAVCPRVDLGVFSRSFGIYLDAVIPEIKCERWSSLQIYLFLLPAVGTPSPKNLIIIDKVKPVKQQLKVVFYNINGNTCLNMVNVFTVILKLKPILMISFS